MPSRWSNKVAAERRFAFILDDPASNEVFNPVWTNTVAASIDRLRKTLVGLIVASVVPTGYLALTLMNIKSEISFFGLRVDDKGSLFGIALLATSLLGLYGARVAILAAQSEQLLSVWARKRHGGGAFYALAFGSSLFEPPAFTRPPGDPMPTAAARSVQIIAQGLFVVATWALAIAVAVVQGWATWTAITKPVCIVEQGEIETITVCVTHSWRAIMGWIALALAVANFLVYVLYWLPYLHREQSKQSP